MDDPDQVRAYADAGRADGLMAAAYLFHTARISQVIQGCREVVDLGCGPATQLCQVAALNPAGPLHRRGSLAVDAVERAWRMSRSTTASTTSRSWRATSRVSKPSPRRPSTASCRRSALHHLPSTAHLEACFGEIARILRPGGALYLADFGRLKSLKSVLYFAYMNAKHQPHVFSLDYERSLRAAFLADELRALAARKLPEGVRVHCTFLAPLLVAIQTEPRSLPDALPGRSSSQCASGSRAATGSILTSCASSSAWAGSIPTPSGADRNRYRTSRFRSSIRYRLGIA